MRNFSISHQTLCINKIDFDNNWICGHTEIVMWPRDPQMVRIHLNAKQIRIHSTQLGTLENDIGIMETDLAMSYHDPFMAISRKSDYNFFNLDNFIKMHISSAKRVDLDEGIGELTLQIPPEFWSHIAELKPVKLIVEFSLFRPKAGLYFVKPTGNKNGGNSSGAYLFTSTAGNMSRLWFPCVDCAEPCTWKIEITVNEDLVAISNGLLLDSVYTPDLHSKVYHYFLKQPVPASSIGLVVGEFEIYPDPLIDCVTHFCPPRFLPLLKTTVESIPQILKFIEDKLNFNYPFDMYKTVFVDNSYEYDFQSYSSMTIFDLNLLHPPNMLDQSLVTLQTISRAIPEQFFGHFTVMKSWPHAWVPWGISGYLSRLYMKTMMGVNEYRYNVRKEMDEVVNYEEQNGGIVLDPSECKTVVNYNFSLHFAQASNCTYINMYKKKAALIVRLLELKLGPSMILKVFRKLLLLASMAQNTTLDTNFAGSTVDEHRTNLLLCAELLKYAVDLVSGSQITNFLEMWVFKPGHVRLQAEYQFNRRRNVAELSIKQFHHRIRGCFEYTGPIEVVTQEFEGFFQQKVRIDRPVNSTQSRIVVDIPLHTKVRKHRKRKVTLSNGAEVDIDLPPNDNDIPYLWIMLDINMALFGKIDLIQPDRICLLILRHEQDALAQISAIEMISAARDASYLSILRDIVQNNKIFYQTRIQAAIGMKDIMNNIHQVNQGGLRDVFTTLYYTKTGKSMICSNDFKNLGNYRLQVAIIRQLALLQTSHGLCPSDIPTLLFNLLLYNDNSSNRYSDIYYKAEIIRAMGDAIRMGVFHRGDSSLEFLPPEIKMILKDVLRCLTLDQAMPSYKFTITQPCLMILRRLQEYAYIVDEPSIFYPYVTDNFTYDVRKTALLCLISAVDGLKNYEVLEYLMVEVIMNDNFSARLRFDAVNGLIDKFKMNNYSSNRQDIYRMYWNQILPQLYRFVDCQASSDWRLRSAMITLTKCIADLGSNNSMDHNSGRNTTPRDMSDSMPFESGQRINIFDACRSPQRQNDITRLSDDSDVEIL